MRSIPWPVILKCLIVSYHGISVFVPDTEMMEDLANTETHWRCTVHCTTHCPALHCTERYTVLHCTMHSIVLHRKLYWNKLYCTVLYCKRWHCTVLQKIVLHTKLLCTLNCTMLYFTALHSALHTVLYTAPPISGSGGAVTKGGMWTGVNTKYWQVQGNKTTMDNHHNILSFACDLIINLNKMHIVR